MRRTVGAAVLAALLAAVGCAKQQKAAQLSGKVLFDGKPVPAGYISFMPDVTAGAKGSVRVAQIKDGVYDTAASDPPGVFPGVAVVRIAGFDGKPLPKFPQGKQIFNPYELRETIADGKGTKDFNVPASAAANLRIEPTADD